ncbi:ryanodine receptor 1-like, partial [Phasianus colchicus]|uniref:ryanodine receptor 1-like n=1 Tax=Phasianus colchicus TaxID=9054 RepID=UPI00129D34B7
FGAEETHEENRVHLGNAIMSFYAALIDLLGRCAPEMHLIQAGKGEALRIRAILRSLVPLDDLVGVISLPLQIPAFGKGVGRCGALWGAMGWAMGRYGVGVISLPLQIPAFGK